MPAAVARTASYNVNGQLTSLSRLYTTMRTFQPAKMQYTYSATANNGQITQMTDISGETASYTYDALKRLTGATSVTGSTTNWTQSFGYDGFGNMTSKSLNGGGNSAPVVDPTTNRLTSGYDANGNMLTGYGLTMTYDGRNRAASASQMGGTEYYGYAPDNKRIYRWNAAAGTEEFTLYGAQGERLGTFAWATPGSPQFGFVPTETNVWFGKKLINRWVVYGGPGPQVVMRDRLGSDREMGARYYPYGDEITSTPNDAEKYATYVRDSFTTLDYADQRYYASSYGRFNTPDPMAASAKSSNPGSWNRYNYTLGDPVNNSDPSGMNLPDPNSPGGYAGLDPCSQITMGLGWGDDPDSPDGSILTAIACGQLGGYPMYPQPTPAPQPTCSIDLFSRGTPTQFPIGTHTYIEISDPELPGDPNQVLESGPTQKAKFFNPGGNWGVMQAYDPNVNGGQFTDPLGTTSISQSALLDSTSGGQAVCNEVAALLAAYSNYEAGPLVPYKPIPKKGSGNYNSNSFTYTLLNDIGLSNVFTPPTAFGWAPGWGLQVSGLAP